MTPRAPDAGTNRGGRRPSPRRSRMARAEAVPASVRRFNQRARQRRLRTARPFLVAAAIVALLGAVAWAVWRTPVLGVRQVRVVGNTLVNADEVRAAARVARGTPLAGVDLHQVGARVVAALPPVRKAEVTRDWPGTLVVTVTERTPAAMVAAPDKSWLVLDASGVVFEHLGAAPDLPVLVVPAPGPKDSATLAALTVLAALPPALLDLLVRLEAPAPTRISLVLRGGRQIIWGDATQNEAKVATATALLGRSDDVIDVSAPGVVRVN
jgi:cell division protein FtsQ